jgi:hypothetical protein
MATGKRAAGFLLLFLSITLGVLCIGAMIPALLVTAGMFLSEGPTAHTIGMLVGDAIVVILMGAAVRWLFKKGWTLRQESDPLANPRGDAASLDS